VLKLRLEGLPLGFDLRGESLPVYMLGIGPAGEIF